MIESRLFLCSGATVRDDDAIRKERRIIELDSIGSQANVNIRFENVAKVSSSTISLRD